MINVAMNMQNFTNKVTPFLLARFRDATISIKQGISKIFVHDFATFIKATTSNMQNSRNNEVILRITLACVVVIIVSLISSQNLMSAPSFGISSGGIGGEITLPEDQRGLFDGLIKVYNSLINVTKRAIESNMKLVVKPANALLLTIASAYIVGMGAKSFFTGQMFLMVTLSALLNFKWYEQYILKNLEILFNQLQTLFSSGGDSVIEGIIKQTSLLADNIWQEANRTSWYNFIPYILAGIAITSLALLTGVVILNVLFATIKFYIVLSLSSILILLFFFKFTRNFAMGGVQIVFGAIMNITLLSIFLNIFGNVIKEALSFGREEDFFTACISIIIISFVGVALLKVVSEIAQGISGQAIGGEK